MNSRQNVIHFVDHDASFRKHEVFGLVVLGCLNKQIAHQLGTAERMVKVHRHSVMQKLGARSVAKLVSIAVKIGHLIA